MKSSEVAQLRLDRSNGREDAVRGGDTSGVLGWSAGRRPPPIALRREAPEFQTSEFSFHGSAVV
jgi:hypothetical protein